MRQAGCHSQGEKVTLRYMCLLAIAFQTHPDAPLIVTSNRDEFYPRPTLAMHWWEDAPILAGKDLQAGGTWMGLSRNGRFAAVTNYRYIPENGELETKPLSRGNLVCDFLCSTQSSENWVQSIAASAAGYAGFNLLLYDGQTLVYWNNYQNQPPKNLAPGVYALSNNNLDSPWPKVDHARQTLCAAIDRPDIGATQLPELIATLSVQKTYARKLLPKTGLSEDWEELLSSPFIVAEGYGTRASAAIVISASAQVAAMETTHEAGAVLGSQVFNYRIVER